MKRLLVTLFFIGLVAAGCGKKNSSTTSVPNNGHAVPNASTGAVDLNLYRSMFETTSMAQGVVVGDSFEQIKIPSTFRVNINFFGKPITNHKTIKRKVTDVTSEYVELDYNDRIERINLINEIFDDALYNGEVLRASRGCIYTVEAGVLNAVIIEKFRSYDPFRPVKSLAISTSSIIPLYLNPVQIGGIGIADYYVRRFKSTSTGVEKVINIIRTDKC